jgi:RNA methyltransferase, TrmH family
LVGEAVAAGWELEAVFVAAGTAPPNGDAPVFELAPGVLERVATTQHPQPVLGVVRRRQLTLAGFRPASFALVLAGVADPGNGGTILRSAEAAGVDCVVTTVGSVDLANPKVVRASAGALFHVPVVEGVAPSALRELGLPLLGTVAHGGVRYTDAPLAEPVALVLGNETHGLADDLPLDGLVSVPHRGRAESLNVAMAATVLCFEVARQRAGGTPPDAK